MGRLTRKSRSHTLLAFPPKMSPPVGADDVLVDTQTQPAALAAAREALIDLVELFEDLLQLPRRDPMPLSSTEMMIRSPRAATSRWMRLSSVVVFVGVFEEG